MKHSLSGYLRNHIILSGQGLEFYKQYFKDTKTFYESLNLDFRGASVHLNSKGVIEYAEIDMSLPVTLKAFKNNAHGGALSSILESCCVVMYGFPRLLGNNAWMIAVEWNIKFHHPIPIEESLKVLVRCTQEDDERKFHLEAKVFSTTGKGALATGTGFFLKQSL